MKTKAQKKESLDTLAREIPASSITVFTTFARTGEQGLSVAQMQKLKRALRAQGSRYLVTKKTLIDKAMHDAGFAGVDVFGMEGSMGLALGGGDAYAVAKELYRFAKENKALQMLGAWLDGHALTREELLTMATLPSRDELLARLLGILKYPLSSLAVVLNAVAEKKGVTA